MNYLVHYNHYERLDRLIVQQKPLDSTHQRWKRGQELGELFTIHDAMLLLGDSKNEAFPIFRVPSTTDANSVTLCTAHFDFHRLQLLIYQQNPRENNEPSFAYDLSALLTA